MKPTKEELAEKYNEYNELYFNGEMEKLTTKNFFFISKKSSHFGRYRYKTMKNGKTISQIWIGTNVEWDEESLRELLVHEMIHMYNFTVEHSRLTGLLGHGIAFRRQCKRIKEQFGLDIHIHPNFELINGMPTPAFWERALLWIIDR